ncbi:hypothetical protein ACTXT7_017325 [Hymenolepis weldensis]
MLEPFTFELTLFRPLYGTELAVVATASTPHIPAVAHFDWCIYEDIAGANRRCNAIYGNDSTFNNPPQPTDTSVTFSPQVKVAHFHPNLIRLELSILAVVFMLLSGCPIANINLVMLQKIFSLFPQFSLNDPVASCTTERSLQPPPLRQCIVHPLRIYTRLLKGSLTSR